MSSSFVTDLWTAIGSRRSSSSRASRIPSAPAVEHREQHGPLPAGSVKAARLPVRGCHPYAPRRAARRAPRTLRRGRTRECAWPYARQQTYTRVGGGRDLEPRAAAAPVRSDIARAESTVRGCRPCPTLVTQGASWEDLNLQPSSRSPQEAAAAELWVKKPDLEPGPGPHVQCLCTIVTSTALTRLLHSRGRGAPEPSGALSLPRLQGAARAPGTSTGWLLGRAWTGSRGMPRSIGCPLPQRR
jgi:hypothetical protein